MTDTQNTTSAKAAFNVPEYNPSVLSFLSNRRSNLAKLMSGPAPDAATLEAILTIAGRVPDHRKLTPWRFVVFSGSAREKFGIHLKDRFLDQNPEASDTALDFESGRLLRAPLVVAVVSSPKDCPRGTPIWEQELSSGAVCFNMLMATQAHGFAAQWLTEWFAYDQHISDIMGLSQDERIAGFIYMGTAQNGAMPRQRPIIANLLTYWS